MNFINFHSLMMTESQARRYCEPAVKSWGCHSSRLQKPPDCSFDNISVLKAENGTLKRRHSERHLQYALFLN